MKKGINTFIILLSFFGGSLITYFTLQFSYFKINSELNVVKTLLSIITALISLYIAISIKKKNNRNQSLHSIVQTKMDNIWNEFSAFNRLLHNQNTIQLKIATKTFKSLYQELENIKIIFSTFNINHTCIDALEKSMEDFDNLITGDLPISNNMIILYNNETVIKEKSTIIHKYIVNALKKVNEIL